MKRSTPVELTASHADARGHIPDARQCALLLLLLIERGEGEMGKAISRFRVSELTLCRMWGRTAAYCARLRRRRERLVVSRRPGLVPCWKRPLVSWR